MIFKNTQFYFFTFIFLFSFLLNYLLQYYFDNTIENNYIATFLVYFTQLIVLFLLIKLFVFHHSTRSILYQFFYFSVISVISLAQVVLIKYLLINYVFISASFFDFFSYLSLFIAILLTLFTSYLAHKYITFKVET